MTPEERLQRHLARKAKRESDRRTEAEPLLAAAGLVPPATPAELAERRVRQKAAAAQAFTSLADLDQEHRRRASILRDQVAARVSPADLAACDARLTAHPDSGAYQIEFWRERLRRLGEGLPVLDAVQAWTEADREASRERIRRLLAAWKLCDAEHPEALAWARERAGSARRWDAIGRLREQYAAAAGLPALEIDDRADPADEPPQLELFGDDR